MGVNNSYDENFFIFCMWVHYHIIYSIGTKKWYVTKQIKKIWVSVWNEVWLDFESLDPNSEEMEGIYKTDNFINDNALGISIFVFFDLNTYLQF